MLNSSTGSTSSYTTNVSEVSNHISHQPGNAPASWLSLDLAALEAERKSRLVKIICKVELVGGLLGSVISVINAVFQNQPYFWAMGGFIFLTVIGTFVAMRLCDNGSLHTASWIAIASIFLSIAFVDISESVTTLPAVGMSCIPIILSVILLSRLESLLVTGASLLFMITTYLVQVTFTLYQPPAAQVTPITMAGAWICTTLVVVPCIYGLLQGSFVNQTQALQEQYRRLQESYRELDRRQRLSEELSHEISSLTSQLETLTNEQASRTSQQVTAVSQVTASLEELDETAQQIALSSTASTQSSQQTLAVVEQVRDSSQLSYRAAQQGNQAVEKANGSVKAVHGRIDMLEQRLLNLTEQTRQVGTIVNIIDDIASETHLLALNASIEAAGASSADYSWSQFSKNGHGGAPAGLSGLVVQGERFGVIAQEIRNLADRSRKAAKEVQGFIGEMQGAVGAATQVAEESKKEAASALEVSEQVTSSINDLTEVVAQNVTSVEHILSAAQTVSQNCREISSAINQQRSANFQILQTMREISSVAQISANELGGLAGTAGRLNSRVDALNLVLDT